MSPFNRPDHTPITHLTHPNYSAMDHELSYGSVSLHTQDSLEIEDLLRDYADVSKTSNP